MLASLSKKISQKNTLLVVLGLLVLVIFVPNVTHANLLESFLWGMVNMVFGWLLWVSGMLLDYSINDMVVGFGDMYTKNGLGLTIDTLWVTVRDIFNLTFIFGLVFIGLRMIFGSDSNTKKMLVSIILAALLVNFSLFITKFVVDFSNIAAVQLVNSFPLDSAGKPSVSGDFMRLMGLTSVLDFTSKAGADFEKMTGGGSIGYIFGTMFLYIITSFVFFAGALLLIIRFVVLNIYMVLSPIMFIGWVFPSMAKYSSEYWSGFLSRCFVAPAYILMLYFSAKVLASFSVTGAGGANSLSTMWTKVAPASFASVFPPFILTAVFLIAAVVVAQKMSATGGSAVISMQDKLMKKTKTYAGAAALGTVATLGRNTVGKQVNKRIVNSKKFQAWADRNGATGKAASKLASRVADSTFDGRNVMGIGAATGYGTGTAKGYVTAEKERNESDLKYAKSLGQTDTRNKDGSLKLTGNTNADGTPETIITAKYNQMTATARANESSELAKSEAAYASSNIAKNAALAALATKQAAIQTEKKPLVDKISALEQELLTLPTDKLDPSYNPLRAKQIEAEITKAKGNLQPIDIKHEAEISALNDTIATADKDLKTKQLKQAEILKTLALDAENSIRYERQLSFIQSKQADADALNIGIKRLIGAGAATGAVFGGPVGSVVGAALGIVAKPITNELSSRDKSSYDNLTKEYGQYGRAMLDSDTKKKQAKILADAIKDNTEPEKPAPAVTA